MEALPPTMASGDRASVTPFPSRSLETRLVWDLFKESVTEEGSTGFELRTLILETS